MSVTLHVVSYRRRQVNKNPILRLYILKVPKKRNSFDRLLKTKNNTYKSLYPRRVNKLVFK